ncbi:aminoglycoside adenylyltransferase domain-containing protein [Bacillus mycoides]|uniref:aminoglycoside adenylyltransferase domain-containing protein n=1 Tax=Bacillus mycoides TaxID=1405 RepID=UPI003D2352A5
MDSKIPIPVQNILSEYISLFHERLPKTLEGLYLHGSIALNTYINGSSDIDFISIVNRYLTKKEVKILSEIHREINNKYKRTCMDGCYLLWEDIGKRYAEEREYLSVNEGKVNWSYDVLNPITWWILKNKGINIMGPEINSFHFEVNEEILVDYVLINMNTYWLKRTNTIKRVKKVIYLIPNKLVDREIQWSITGMLRQLYTFREQDIISKIDAGKYALSIMPERFHNIIKEAINISEGVDIRYCDSKMQRVNDTIKCMDYILNYCNNISRFKEDK